MSASPDVPTVASAVASQLTASSEAMRAKLVSKDPQIIKQMKKYMEIGKTFYSFEYFPPKTREGVTNLYARLDRMDLLSPLFMDLTWGAGGSNSDLALEIAGTVQGMCAAQMMLHLTCTNVTVANLKETLDKAKQAGIRNILALRGDPPKGSETWEATEGGFTTAAQLVAFIRQEYGDYFGIGVSGYPEGHISCVSLEQDIIYLKAKIDAGADFIITQLFYDVDLYLAWIEKIRAIGITCPVIPGIMPIQNYNGFIRMTSFCKTAVPAEISEALERVKEDDEAVKQYGIDLGISMCRKLIAAGVPGLHFYTLNLERSVAAILEGLGMITTTKPGAATSGRLPWKQSLVAHRSKKEDVRPIFWANRPRSYLERTIHWDEFPNGRWGDATSPAFGDLSDYHLCNFRAGSVEERRALWGASPTVPVDLFKVFADYIDGTCARLPWCEHPIQLETVPLKDFLKRMNMFGLLTINSQPRVNGAPSSDSAVGWGGPGGYVYQKAYMEFFTSAAHLSKIMKLAAAEAPSISITALNHKGDKVTNVVLGEKLVNAVTWGVFPNREIVQPTVVDVDSFTVWKDEAFALWISQWQPLYEQGSPSHDLIQTIHDTYYLVNMVDNDYIKGDLFAFFAKIMQ